MTLLFAATYPERTTAAVLYGSAAPRSTWAPDFTSAPRREEWLDAIALREQAFGSKDEVERTVEWLAPSLRGDDEFIEWFAGFQRQSASPSAIGQLSRMNMAIDIRHVLPTIRVPTCFVHRVGDAIPVDHARYMAQRILGAELVELLVERHHGLVRSQLARYRGREIDTAGDGFFATFDGPARAIQCAKAISASVRELGIEIRAGLHTEEVELAEERPRGIAVHIGARVSARAEPGEVLVSNTVKDLVAGSGIEFDERGTAELKGVPGEWRLYAVRN
jgi:Adenylate and Guanylate cyclase catalytic domain